MDDHPSQTDDQQTEPEATVATGNSPDASADAKQVPLSELVKQRQEASRLRDEKKQLEEQLAKLQGHQEKPPQAKPEPKSDDLTQRLQKLERQNTLRELMSEHDLTPKQADAVVSLMAELPNLNPAEARALAAHRDPETFSSEGESSGFNPAIHGSSRPTPGSTPQPQQESDVPARIEHLQKLQGSNKDQYNRVLNNWVGAIAAQQTGRTGHTKIPIPKTQQ